MARNALAAHDPTTALHASVQAGDDAMSVGGPDEAVRHYELALEVAGNSALMGTEQVVELTTKASAAASASGHLHKAVALVQDGLDRLPADTSPAQRARLLYALAAAALLSDINGDALAATTEALALVPAEPATELRSRVLGVHARALADLGRDEDATRWAGEALTLGRQLGLRDVVADVTTTLARMQQRSGDPVASRAALERVIDEAHASGDATELRGLHHLGGSYYEQGRLTEALKIYRRGADRALEIGRPWAPYGLDARVLAAVVAYDAGQWDVAERIVDVRGQSPPPMAEAALLAASMYVHAGRGSGDPAAVLPRIRPWWASDGMIAIVSAGPAIDMYGDADDLDAAQAVYDDVVSCVGGIWQLPDFQGRVRLSGLLLAQLSAAASRTGGRELAELARRGDELAAAAARASALAREASRSGPEAVAWVARVRAEHLRLRWLTGVDPPSEDHLVEGWRDSVAAFTRYPHAFELARSQTRLAAVLRAAGATAQARELSDLARVTAHRLDAQPLLGELRALGGSSPGRASALSGEQALTPREQEMLALVAQGRSNREIATRLYISSKTVSVHVSNILAKLAAAGRTEAVAVARRRGLLCD